MPPYQKINQKKKAVQLSCNSEKNVNCSILAYFTKQSGVRDLITSHFADLNLVHKHLQTDVIFGQTRFSPWNWLPDMRNSKDQKPNADKRDTQVAEIDEVWARNIVPSLVQQQLRPQQL